MLSSKGYKYKLTIDNPLETPKKDFTEAHASRITISGMGMTNSQTYEDPSRVTPEA